MSETGLFERFVVALEKIAASAPKAPAIGGAAPPPKSPPANAAAAGKAAEKAAADAKAKAEAEAKAKATAAAKGANKPAPGSTKAPGGKYNAEQVRDIIRKVANNPSLGKQSAREALENDGGGVTTVSELKPEFFDAVYEACQVLLNGEGSATASDEFDPTA